MCKLQAEFQPVDTAKKNISQMLCKRSMQDREVAIRKSLFSQNPWILSVTKLILDEVERCQPANLRKNFHTSSFIYFAFIFIFSNALRLLLPKRFWKYANTASFKKHKQKFVLLVIYLFNYNSSNSTFFMLKYGIWRCL